jgi:hypothetical protein
LFRCDLADSVTDAARKIKAGAVRIGNEVTTATHILVDTLPATLPIRVGKRMKMAVIYKE